MRKRYDARNAKNDEDKHITNEDIRAPKVLLIGAGGEQVGVIDKQEALQMAEDAGMDLVAVAPDADPPVCRILDYGKLKYREQKKAAETRKRSVTQSVKELRIRYRTDKHDLETKIRRARSFLEDGDRVKFSMRFRGREVVYEDLGIETFEKVKELLDDIAAVEDFSPLTGNRMSITFAPKKD